MFIKHNTNPKGQYVGDCVIRAISNILDRPWGKVYVELCAYGYEMCDMPSSNHVWGSFLLDTGFKRYILPNECPNCYTVRDFCKDYPEGNYILATGSHVIAVRDGNYYDTWDSGDEIPIYYWKEQTNAK